LTLKQEIAEKQKHIFSLGRKHDDKKLIHEGLLVAGQGGLKDAQLGFDTSLMNFDDLVKTIKDFRMKEFG
jgi:hypothetical protein